MFGWLRRRQTRPPRTARGAAAGEPLWAVEPPEGVKLLTSRPSKTGEEGRGVLARYSDGTTASAMVNSDGSVRVLFFRSGKTVPALPVAGTPNRFTWQRSR